MTNDEIDAAWDSPSPAGFGKSRYDIARAIIAAHEVQQQAGQEPVAWMDRAGRPHRRYRDAVLDFEREPVPLYAAPQPAAQPAPVDEALRLAVERTRDDLGATGDNYPAVRKLLAFAESHIKAMAQAVQPVKETR